MVRRVLGGCSFPDRAPVISVAAMDIHRIRCGGVPLAEKCPRAPWPGERAARSGDMVDSIGWASGSEKGLVARIASLSVTE